MLIAMIASLIIIVGAGVRNKLNQLFGKNGSETAKLAQFFNPGRMHRFPITIPKN